MSEASNFCANFIKLPWIERCMTMAEWSATWQNIGIVVTLIVGAATVWKIWSDIDTSRAQKINSEKLERTKFFLEQHRRLFDDQDLKEVLQYIDGDDDVLAQPEYWDKNRKFLVFIEEIQLLINSGLLDEDVCLYMFGHYASCAMNGKNFMEGIDFTDGHWGLFKKFAIEYESRKRLYSTNYVKDLKN